MRSYYSVFSSARQRGCTRSYTYYISLCALLIQIAVSEQSPEKHLGGKKPQGAFSRGEGLNGHGRSRLSSGATSVSGSNHTLAASRNAVHNGTSDASFVAKDTHNSKSQVALAPAASAAAASAAVSPAVQPMSATVTLQDTKSFLHERRHGAPRGGRHAKHVRARASDSFFTDMNQGLDAEEMDAFDEEAFGVVEGSWSEEMNQDPHYRKVWNIVKTVKRHKNKKRTYDRNAGVAQFFESTSFYEWSIFAAALAVFVPLYYYLLDWPSTTRYHAMALLIWLALGGVYNALVCVRMGKQAGVMWFTGYLLEFIFSIENVFVFHIVVKAFRTPRRLTQKALFFVICCQIVFEMTFFMGLAEQVRSMVVLPYVLGVWLLYVGYHASLEEAAEEFNIKDSAIFRLSELCLGQRLSPVYEDSCAVILIKGGRLCVSLLFPLICCLLAVDFILEVDVTLTKIEEIPNEYIAFTSSACAAFAMPELFFVARDLFQRYHLLKYGISFVLVFFGMQMLLHRFFEIPDLVGCAIIIMVMVLCMIASDMHRQPTKQLGDSEEFSGHHDADKYKSAASWPPIQK